MDVRAILELRTRLENRIKALGGTLPPTLPWDNGELRNWQLLEEVERLEREGGQKCAR